MRTELQFQLWKLQNILLEEQFEIMKQIHGTSLLYELFIGGNKGDKCSVVGIFLDRKKMHEAYFWPYQLSSLLY